MLSSLNILCELILESFVIFVVEFGFAEEVVWVGLNASSKLVSLSCGGTLVRIDKFVVELSFLSLYVDSLIALLLLCSQSLLLTSDVV